MKKGIKRIVAGSIMIILQVLSLIGNAKVGIGIQLSFYSVEVFLYDLMYLVGYLFVGIVGAILLIWGINAYSKDNQ